METTEILKQVGKSLPHGSLTKIADKCNVSLQYVSQFFNGKYSLSSANIKILDAAKEIQKQDAKEKQSAQNKLNEMLSSQKE